jgi:5-methylcytosine-specific restriction endonuclease McrA
MPAERTDFQPVRSRPIVRELRSDEFLDSTGKVSGRCHLCHEKVDLALYGRTGAFGADTVTVDHLEPQIFGGSDDADNLRIAHHNCNSLRGIDDPEEARLALVNTTDEPLSDAAFTSIRWRKCCGRSGGGSCLCRHEPAR